MLVVDGGLMCNVDVGIVGVFIVVGGVGRKMCFGGYCCVLFVVGFLVFFIFQGNVIWWVVKRGYLLGDLWISVVGLGYCVIDNLNFGN